MSNEIQKTHKRRKYRKRRRAEQEEETRRRIAEALVELHGSIGPARTTVSEVAERAGVQRATVYRHFPDEQSMFDACSSHWAEQNPFPDPESWTRDDDPHRRLRTGLEELYDFYARNRQMLDNTTRDEPRVDALKSSMEGFRAYLGTARDTLAAGLARRGSRRASRIRAAIGHALSFSTWRSLELEQGLRRDDAVELMTAMVDAAARR